MKRKKDVTMQDIADRLNVSKVTVSKALNFKEGVGAELRKKIQDCAIEMGYKMIHNTAMSTGMPCNIGIFLNEKFATEAVGFYLKFYQYIAIELRKEGYLSTMFTITKTLKNKKELSQLLTMNNIRGIILLGEVDYEFLKEVKRTSLPCVLIDFYNKQINMDSITTENIYSTYELTNHLYQNGHTEIGFVGSIYATTSIQDRFLGYYRFLMEHKFKLRNDWIIPDRDEAGNYVEFELPEQMPTAFVCNCDDTAYRFIRFLKQKNYRVPEDVSIVSFDNDVYAELCEPKLTTIEVDCKEMARKAAKSMKRKVEMPEASKHTTIYVEGNVIYRNSVYRRVSKNKGGF